MPNLAPSVLYDALVEIDVVPKESLDLAWQRAQTTGEHFKEELKRAGLLSDLDLGRVIADVQNWPFVRLEQVPTNQHLFNLLTEPFIRTHLVVVYAESEQKYAVATAYPCDYEMIDRVRKALTKPITISYATQADIVQCVNRATSNMASYTQSEQKDLPQTIDRIIESGAKQHASDIHLEPGEEHSLARLRIDGMLHDIASFTLEEHGQMVTRIKVLAKLRTDEHQAAQDGKLHADIAGEQIDIRVSIVPTTNGEKVVMRILSKDVREYTLADLGLSPQHTQILQRAIHSPFGMILASGPTGSGKTTTLYSLLKLINSRNVNIMTIEDPVEYTIEGVNQIQVNVATNLTFADGLRSIVRQDPNIILVGEIRDADTAKISVSASMTGHLVLSTLHANTAATVIPRLADMGVEPFLIGTSLQLILSQRLVRKICQSCRVSEELTFEEVITQHQLIDDHMTQHIKALFRDHPQRRWYKGKGCDICHQTGYQGRIGIFEILEMNDALREGLAKHMDADALQTLAIQQGITTILEDGMFKVTQGLTTLDEVLRATKD